MLYPFMTYIDGMEIVCSDIFFNPNTKTYCIHVYFERVHEGGQSFDSMDCILPASIGGGMEHIVGFTEKEAKYHYTKISKLTDVMMEYVTEEAAKYA